MLGQQGIIARKGKRYTWMHNALKHLNLAYSLASNRYTRSKKGRKEKKKLLPNMVCVDTHKHSSTRVAWYIPTALIQFPEDNKRNGGSRISPGQLSFDSEKKLPRRQGAEAAHQGALLAPPWMAQLSEGSRPCSLLALLARNLLSQECWYKGLGTRRLPNIKLAHFHIPRDVYRFSYPERAYFRHHLHRI